MPLSRRTRRSPCAYFKNEMKPHNGSVSRSTCWRRRAPLAKQVYLERRSNMKVQHETQLHDPGHGRDEESARKEGAMKLPPDVEFHEDIRLLMYRPRGL